MKYGLKILLFHSYFERWKLEIDKYNSRLRKFMETCQMLNYTDQIYLNYEVLQTEIWNMSPDIFLKVEIWVLIFLSLKVRRWFLLVTYPSQASVLKLTEYFSNTFYPTCHHHPLHFEIPLPDVITTMQFYHREQYMIGAVYLLALLNLNL